MVKLKVDWVQKGPGHQGAGLKCPSPTSSECVKLAVRGFPFCSSTLGNHSGALMLRSA